MLLICLVVIGLASILAVIVVSIRQKQRSESIVKARVSEAVDQYFKLNQTSVFGIE